MSDDVLARVAEIEARANAATEGPWRERYTYKKDPPGTLIAATAPGHQVVMDNGGGTRPSLDLAFIAAARTDIPMLCTAVRDLAAKLAEAERALVRVKPALLGKCEGCGGTGSIDLFGEDQRGYGEERCSGCNGSGCFPLGPEQRDALALIDPLIAAAAIRARTESA